MNMVSTRAGVVLLISSCDAFTRSSWSHAPAIHHHQQHSRATYLLMADEPDAAIEDEAQVEEEEPQLDPEVVELKAQIETLDAELKSKKSSLSNLKDMSEKYSSTGYARQVALVENNKRMRRSNVADNQLGARASVLQSFLPVLDELDALGQKYEGNAFASTLDSGLRSELNTQLGSLGVSEYGVGAGDAMDIGRVVAVEEQYSEEVAKGSVIQIIRPGLEISGNVVRPAEVIGSLGSEASAEEGDESAAEESE
mmetsp:Transcript_1360/g.3228  ORF Transcript_1360/g.3228 Transcript_1360/m.3228 type:complete len:254 (+) Transcript_1360:114-875(+)